MHQRFFSKMLNESTARQATLNEQMEIFQKMKDAVYQYKDRIVAKYHELMGNPEAAEAAYERIKSEYGVQESVEPLVEEEDAKRGWREILDTVAGWLGTGVNFSLLTMSILIVFLEVGLFAYIFSAGVSVAGGGATTTVHLLRGIIGTAIFEWLSSFKWRKSWKFWE